MTSFFDASTSSATTGEGKQSLQHSCGSTRTFTGVTFCSEDSVADLHANLDTSKSTGVDDISARMLKAWSYSIAPTM